MYILFFSFFLSFFLFFFFFCEIYGCYGCYKFGDQLPSRICFSYNFIQVKSSLLFTSCGTALKLASMHCSLTSISFQLYVILTGNIIQIYNFGCCRYYLEETTDRGNAWMLIEEIHSFYYEERHSGLFLVVA